MALPSSPVATQGERDAVLHVTTSSGTVEGTDKHEVIMGSAGADTLMGGGGNDHLYGVSPSGGADGSDLLSGGDGSDYLQGNAGNDTLYGGKGSDRINGGADDDIAYGDGGNDSINGNRGNDRLYGGDGNDQLRGGQGDDSLDGGEGNDTLQGDLGRDTLAGGSGMDRFLFIGHGSPVSAPDRIVDFTPGADHILLGFAPAALLSAAAQPGLAAASAVAQMLFNAHGGDHEVASIAVGSDCFLFYASDGGGTVDAAIQLQSLNPAALGLGDF